ncbi:tRNA (cytidine(34)-2'-O)-methyltransferase [Pararhizobium mangrovi]|uniref:tRNA (cytidine(34)-2'-O)-methyltransferase n=1 Tax=Pararhizobium mangrovi TaxID=2590452 RepID=A0A506UHT8_9HYPH|nr:tRNA (cytidine(34)-2'-O)-methyltransferase [Pararhizobium mangrovi]TPW32877.1 tRNA (cytidine(34)-2'-O)-methyltransferase [Pararhizobium mangrovi]
MSNLRIALYQPDIPGNTGTILRMAACLDLTVDLIEPAGFVLTDRALKRAGMDYLAEARLVRHASWEAFEAWRRGEGRRLVLSTTHAAGSFLDHAFAGDDVLLMGRESAGVPEHVHAKADMRIRIPLAEGSRSLNVAVAAGILASEALRQTKGFPSMRG